MMEKRYPYLNIDESKAIFNKAYEWIISKNSKKVYFEVNNLKFN